MRIVLSICIITAILVFASTSGAINPDAMVGIWWNANKTVKISIYKNSDGFYEGKILWSENLDEIGTYKMWNVADDGNGQMKGQCFSNDSAILLYCVVNMESPDSLSMNGMNLELMNPSRYVGKSERWTRWKDAEVNE